MIRICSVNLNKQINDIIISHNVINDSLYKSNFTIVGIMIKDREKEISNQLKEYTYYYYNNLKGRFESYLRQFQVKNIIIAIDLNKIKTKKDVKKYIKTLRKIGKICRRCKTKIGISGEEEGEYIPAIILNYRENLNIEGITIEDLISSVKLEMFYTKKERYNYIYDKTCKILDNEFETKNLCNFKNNKCLEKAKTNVICGCCRHYKNLFSRKLVKCKYLKTKKCTANCITCKFFTCDTLEKQGIKFRIKDFYLINNYFNLLQKFIVKSSYYTKKEKIIRRLLFTGR